MNKYFAVLIDVVSIQKYIFGSNQLKDNLGGSHIIKTLFSEFAKPVFEEIFKQEKQTNDQVETILSAWQDKPETILMKEKPELPFEIGMADGGKALILFREKDPAKEFIKKFTREVLVFSPGIQLAVAYHENFSIDVGEFQKDLETLFAKLTGNRNRYFPVTALTNHGITALYSQSGESITTYDADNGQFLPQEVTTKHKYAKTEEKQMVTKLQNRFSDFTFTNDISNLGQTDGDSYIAVVHIDGNNIGNWFKEATSLVDYRKRSVDMLRITEESFWDMVGAAVEAVGKINKNTPGFELKSEKGKKVLPLRPIILGGDDLTFICHGQLALYLSEVFINSWVTKANDEINGLAKYSSLPNGFSSCAGIAIAKTKAPFYRSYQIAGQSCSAAKRVARAKNGSWLDFQIVRGTKSDSLEDIRKADSMPNKINLYYGPYKIVNDTGVAKNLGSLKKHIKCFKEDKFWADNNLKEFRSALNQGQAAVDTFLVHMKNKGGRLPDFISEIFYITPIMGNQTPYHDILEMMEFYPFELLKTSEGMGNNADS